MTDNIFLMMIDNMGMFLGYDILPTSPHHGSRCRPWTPWAPWAPGPTRPPGP